MDFSAEELKDVLKFHKNVTPIVEVDEPDMEVHLPKIYSSTPNGGTIIKSSMNKSKVSAPILDIEDYSYECNKRFELPKFNTANDTRSQTKMEVNQLKF